MRDLRRSTAISDQGISLARSSTCQACQQSGLSPFYEVADVPAQTCVLLEDQAAASAYPVGEILLGLCQRCGFIQNVSFDPDLVDYSMPTEESQAFSGRFSHFANSLADDLVSCYDLRGKHVLEPGCGKGDFLDLLAERGVASGLGIDPGYLPNRIEREHGAIEFMRDWYDGSCQDLTADLVLTRHLLEHVPNVSEFFGWLRESTAGTPNSMLFTEVPDTTRVLAEGAFWDVYYEHCSYFTETSLRNAIVRAGMAITKLERGFEDQYLLAHSMPVSGEVPELDDPSGVVGLVESFASDADASTRQWRDRINDVLEAGGKVALWGGGSKAVAFLSTVGIHDVTVVDINPHKQGKWLPSVAIQVQPPETLREFGPSLVIAMNPVYLGEISRDLRALGLEPELRAV